MGKWYENPTHPVWGLILVAMVMVGAAVLSWLNASDFDETEYSFLKWFLGWSSGVVFGGGYIAKYLSGRGGSQGPGSGK